MCVGEGACKWKNCYCTLTFAVDISLSPTCRSSTGSGSDPRQFSGCNGGQASGIPFYPSKSRKASGKNPMVAFPLLFDWRKVCRILSILVMIACAAVTIAFQKESPPRLLKRQYLTVWPCVSLDAMRRSLTHLAKRNQLIRSEASCSKMRWRMRRFIRERQYSNENVILIYNMPYVIHYNFSVFIFPLYLFWFIRLGFLTRFMTSPHIYDLCIFICGTVSGGENIGKLVLPIEVTRNHEILRVWCPSVSFSTVCRRKVWADLRRKQSWKSCEQANPPTPRLGRENMFLFRKMQGVPKVSYGFVPSLAYTLAPILLPQSMKWNMVLLQR